MKRKLIIFLLLAAAGYGFYVYRDRILDLPQIKQLTADLKEIERQVSAPGPLRASQDSPISNLTAGGVIAWTNRARLDNGGLPALRGSTKLNAAATAKMKDMFAKQYFAHVGPDGKGPAHWVQSAGYDYIATGENLALGNFADDRELVTAWMNSPGHRANILGSSFQEIGVAVGRGVFEGKITWLAVQEFGKPISACPAVSAALKNSVETNQKTLDQMQSELAVLRTELENTHPKRGEEYEAKVSEYNQLVAEYNPLVETTKDLINQFNAEISRFNACLAQ